MENSKYLVVTPTYNESENIVDFVNKVNNLNLDLLIIDDNSPDGTSNLVIELKNKYENLFLITREKKLGLGSAYRLGFSWALENKYKYIIEMDADFPTESKI